MVINDIFEIFFDFRVTTPAPHPMIPAATIGSWERFGVELVLTFIVVFTYCTANDKKFFVNGSVVIGASYAACSLVAVSFF